MSQYRILESSPTHFQCQESINSGANWVNIGPPFSSHAEAVMYLNEKTTPSTGVKIHEYNQSNQKGPQPLWD